MFNKLKPLLYLALFGMCVSVISFLLWNLTNKGNDNLYFGNVEHRSSESFQIHDSFNGTLTVLLGTSTQLYKGPKKILNDQIVDGMFVHIVGERSDSTIQAEVIRVMDPLPKRK